MKYMKLKNLQIFIEENLICLLFSFYIFFWGIAFNFVQLRFLIFLLILPIFLKIGQITLIKLFKYSIIPLTLLFHLTLQASTLTSNHFFSILGLFLFLIILDIYKDFFFRNLNKIIYFFLIIFFLFVIFQYFSYSDYASQVSNDCVGCFSILKVFFKENSHLALIAPTVIFYLLFISNSNKFLNFFTIIIFSFIFIVNPSLNLYLVLILLTLLSFFFLELNY